MGSVAPEPGRNGENAWGGRGSAEQVWDAAGQVSLEREVAAAEGSPTLSRYLGSVSATNLSRFLLILEGFMTTQLPAGQELPPGKDLALGEQKTCSHCNPTTITPFPPQGGHRTPPSEVLVPPRHGRDTAEPHQQRWPR